MVVNYWYGTYGLKCGVMLYINSRMYDFMIGSMRNV